MVRELKSMSWDWDKHRKWAHLTKSCLHKPSAGAQWGKLQRAKVGAISRVACAGRFHLYVRMSFINFTEVDGLPHYTVSFHPWKCAGRARMITCEGHTKQRDAEVGKELDDKTCKIYCNAQLLSSNECSSSHFRLFPKWNKVRNALIKVR